jgi:hypothetical protein
VETRAAVDQDQAAGRPAVYRSQQRTVVAWHQKAAVEIRW